MPVKVRGLSSIHQSFIYMLSFIVLALVAVTMIFGPDFFAMMGGQRSWDYVLLIYPLMITGLVFLLIRFGFFVRYEWDLLNLYDTHFEKGGASYSYDYISKAQFHTAEEQIILHFRKPLGKRFKMHRTVIPKERIQPSVEALIDLLRKQGIETERTTSYITNRSKEDVRVDGTEQEKPLEELASGKLLYAESRSTYLRNKYETSLLVLIVFGIILILLVYSLLTQIGDLEVTAVSVLGAAFMFAFVTFIIVFFAFNMQSIQMFEIYDNRIALPHPRKPSLFGRKPDNIFKSEIRRAEFKYEELGQWGITFVFKNGETFYLNWFRVQCEEECVPALKEFIRGIEE